MIRHTHAAIVIRAIVFWLSVAAAGCAIQPVATGPAQLSNSERDQIGRMAIRGPSRPSVRLTAELDNKGKAAGKTAAAAGAGWLGASFDAAASSNDATGGLLLLAFGLVTTPVVAAGGAVYGAAAADSDEAIEAGNSVLEEVLDSASSRFRDAFEAEFFETIPAEYSFVPADATDTRLLAEGFDSVMDVRMDSISSTPDSNGFAVRFISQNRIELSTLQGGRTLARRRYRTETPAGSVSSWADDRGGALFVALDEQYAEIADEVAWDFFQAPAIRVQGIEPVDRGVFGAGQISGTVPLFVWSSIDGVNSKPADSVEYEILLFEKGKAPGSGRRTKKTRYVPADPLLSCKQYRWKVRARYLSFDKPVTSEWSDEYRFKTPCRR